MPTPKVKRTTAYLEQILEENKRLSALVSESNTPIAVTPVHNNAATAVPRADNADRNPMIEERPWFISFHAVDLPIHIGEAADAAFATRLRQAVSKQPVSHLPRIQYVGDDTLRALAEQPVELPSHSRVRFLIDVALKAFGKTFHIVRKSIVWKTVDTLINDPTSCGWLACCQVWCLLAIGEAYSARSALPNQPFPGTPYFAKAMQMMYMPFERPGLEVIEIYLLLSFYAAAVNRRHTSITLASQAVRIGVIMGFHIDITETQLRDRALREHRCRLFWTAYRLDRAWCSKVGWPPAIPDEVVEIGLPSDESVPPDAADDFEDAQFIIFAIKLAKMHNHAVNTLYVRKRQATSFSERVQVAVRAMRDWVDHLPKHLQVGLAEDSPYVEPHVLYQHLAYNQAVIVTTRPILLHLLRQRRANLSNVGTRPQVPAPAESVRSLATACIQCARRSMSWLKRSWTEGMFPVFDYFSMQFLFSSATILALSTLMREPGHQNDREDFVLASSFMLQLERSGNYGAKEFCTHLEAIQAVLAENLADAVDLSTSAYQGTSHSDVSHRIENGGIPMSMGPLPGAPLQDFLNQSNLDLDFMDTGGQWVDWQDVFWPQIELPSSLQ